MNVKYFLPILLLAHLAVLRPVAAMQSEADPHPVLDKAMESWKAVLGPQKAKPRKRRRVG